MGVRDTEEMLEAAQAQSLTDERTIAALAAERDDLEQQIDAIRALDSRWFRADGEAIRRWVRLDDVRAILDHRDPKETP